MNHAQSAVGSTLANCAAFFANCAQLANVCQLESHENQRLAKIAVQLVVGSVANLPTGVTSRCRWLFSLDPVGENTPFYYVGEGLKRPSHLRRSFPGDPHADHRRPSVSAILAL
ncbi:hypothetical protein U5801_26730, partial [Lamprobacter modestohalophilus]|uniref:hypothetical protein n=1 Tax=Lamprobacter modestohalophilus TaxID=1064514 RepID=UPI002ADEDEFD